MKKSTDPENFKEGAKGDPEHGEWRLDEGRLYTMVYLYTAIMHGWQIRRLPTCGRFELLKSQHAASPLVTIVDWKTLPKMMYLYVAIMQGWQTRLLEDGGKQSFELLRGHLGKA
jgi:hypothetical protein